MLPTPKYHRKTLPRQLDFHWCPTDRLVFEGNGPLIRVSHLSKSPKGIHFDKIRVYRLSSNHFHSRQMDPEFEFPTADYP